LSLDCVDVATGGELSTITTRSLDEVSTVTRFYERDVKKKLHLSRRKVLAASPRTVPDAKHRHQHVLCWPFLLCFCFARAE